MGSYTEVEVSKPATESAPTKAATNGVAATKGGFDGVITEEAFDKILRIAERTPPNELSFPHMTDAHGSEYRYEPAEWWTSGFFPGSIWALVERYTKHAKLPAALEPKFERLKKQAEIWRNKIEPQQFNVNTHDIGFLIMPAFQRDYELNGSKESAKVIVNAAESLITRWSPKVQALRSWNRTFCYNYQFESLERDFLVIIDNMMNLDLLFSASEITGDKKYADIATRHAETTLKYHVREDNSTYHLVVYDPVTGNRKVGLTHQGYDHESTWSRGQAWGLYGYATVYRYTRDPKFLEAAKKLSDYFISRLDNGIAYWDFDAPRPAAWDTSASMIAASGMLLLTQLTGSNEYIPAVKQIWNAVHGGAVTPSDNDTILTKACIANYRFIQKRVTDHGLVYADYYYLEAGNRLLQLGLI